LGLKNYEQYIKLANIKLDAILYYIDQSYSLHLDKLTVLFNLLTLVNTIQLT